MYNSMQIKCSLHFSLLVLRVFLDHQFAQLNIRYMQKYIPLETLCFILSNSIIFMLYNLYYIDQIDDLDTHACLVK
jgi:hypothetical protein